MRIEPLGDKIVVKRMESEQATAGGIVLPDQTREKPLQGRVLSLGEGRRLADGSRAPWQVSEGDRIVFGRYAGTEVRVGEQDLLIMTEEDVLAILS